MLKLIARGRLEVDIVSWPNVHSPSRCACKQYLVFKPELENLSRLPPLLFDCTELLRVVIYNQPKLA